MGKYKNEKGAVSLFIVIFSALLITVITVGFVRLMLTDQQQASTNDLSQSALDSAQAGVEDGKRALLRYQNICATGDVAACSTAYTDILGGGKCNQGLVHIVDPKYLAKAEVPVVAQSNDTAALDQAYTCVKINPQTVDYLGSLSPNASTIVPIKSQSTVTTVVVQWYDSTNISNNNLDVSLLSAIALPLAGTPPVPRPPLYNQTAAGWGPDRPSIMRTQLMQFGTSFNLTDFDNTNALGESNANTLFLYPTKGPSNTTVDEESFAIKDARLTATGVPTPVSCNSNLGGGGYACTVKLDLPTPINGGTTTGLLRLTALYNASDYRITLYNGATQVNFDNVQPSIDSTGRANDLFRRVDTRVTLTDNSFVYPDAAVDLTGNFCKNLVVTDKAADYSNSCTP
ncbi:hypothetical protein EPN95_04260 [Patescibacteria group bacterium]|nr:MAG: hypothetical protein EPN95_04260 [Patescibacteria group bacterium]